MDFEGLKWAVAHDPCRRGNRSPLGAVTVGTAVELVLRVSEAARGELADVRLIVRDRWSESGGAAFRTVRMEACPRGFSARLTFADEPQVAFYLFELCLVDGQTLFYVPSCDGRTTAGELARPEVDGELSEGCWWPAGWRLDGRPSGELGLGAPSPGFQVTVYEPAFSTPDWLAGAVMYQIFPDRFARSAHGVREEGLAYHARRGRPVRLHESWGEPVEWTGDLTPEGEDALDERRSDGARVSESDEGMARASASDAHERLLRAMRAYDPIDFFGGSLDGIRERLGYLASLGVEVLYLNPIFEARSNHRYDTADYERIDPLLGDEEAFANLAHEAGLRGIRLVLDAVLSHTGNDSRYFNACDSYSEPGAMQGGGSPYWSWYDFTPHASGTPYRSWWGDPTLPEVDERDPSWQRYVLGALGDASAPPRSAPPSDAFGCERVSAGCGLESDADFESAGILPAWIARGAGGYRLDVADEIPDDVLELVRASVKGADAQAAIIGEVWEDPTTKTSYGVQRRYALGTALDSVMNYPLRGALIGFALGYVDAHQLVTFLKLQQANYPHPLYRCCMNLLSSHDVERLRSLLALGGAVKHLPRDEQVLAVDSITAEQDAKAARLQQLLVGLLYALPGSPCIYYGDERGLHGGGDPFCRATFPWEDDPSCEERGDCGVDLTWYYQRVGTLRKDSRALRCGECACAAPLATAACVVRVAPDSGEVVVAAVNRDEFPARVAIDVFADELGLSSETREILARLNGRWDTIFDGAPSAEEAGCPSASSESGIITINLPPLAIAYFRPTEL